MWTTPIDLYCERLDASFWAEPVNALTNAAFRAAAAAAFVLWRREGRGDAAILALILVVVAVGLGSFAFHTLATPGAKLLDVIPIGVFIYGYFLLALRRFLKLSWPATLGLLACFIALSHGLATLVPRAVLNGSSGYFPALAALLVIGLMVRQRPAGRAMLWAAGLFTAALIMRIVDLDVCGALPVGTHFLWHIFDAAVLYAVLRGAIEDRQAG
ncbi:MAG: ceramidase domain-containing protein [Pseudolabrys sp.]